ncbi:MAG: FecR family protein [Phycisphaeraceae bacterium]|nr:FecR family protein [Phycisphaeraceae bacterium]
MSERITEFSVAIERYLDGTANDVDLEALRSGIASDTSLRELFILTLYRDEAIYRINEDRLESDPAFGKILPDSAQPDRGLGDLSGSNSVESGGSRFMLYAAGAAIAALIVVVLYPLVNQLVLPGSSTPRGGSTVFVPDNTASPARLLHAHQMAWGADSKQANTDQSLDAGDYAIDSGYLQFEMSTGVSVIMHAPAAFSIDSPSEISLVSGVLSAKVNEGAEGFVVNTPSGEILDLGTEFGVAVRNNDAVEVHVMDGEVVASLPNNEQIQSLKIGQAGRMEADIGEISLVKPRTEKFVRDWDFVGQSIKHSEKAWYLYSPPKSVVRGQLEDEDRFFILPERKSFTLPRGVRCELFVPGEHTTFLGITTTVPKGSVVDSYLIHFDRAEDIRGSVAVVEGTVYFDRPILGIMTSTYMLFEHDRMLGHPHVQYPRGDAMRRGLEYGKYNKDILQISDDGKTLTVRLEAELNIDQLRVLVQSTP